MLRVKGRNLCAAAVALLGLTLTSMPGSAQIAGTQAENGCNACVQCANNQHALIAGYDDLIGAKHACMGPECPGPHSKCGIYSFRTPEEVDRLILLMASAQSDTLPRLLASTGDGTLMNWQRGLLQFLGCGGEIVAQVPISASALQFVRPFAVAAEVTQLPVLF